MKLQSKIQKSIKTRGVLPTVILINNILSNIIIRNYLKVKYFIHNIISNEYNNDNYNELLSIKYYTPNYRTYYRAITAHKKERLTRNWIKGMSKGDV